MSIELGAFDMGIGLWGVSPRCEIGISRRSVYQRTTSRELARGEANCERATDPRRQAIRHGKSRKGPWHMAKTIASGLANASECVSYFFLEMIGDVRGFRKFL